MKTAETESNDVIKMAAIAYRLLRANKKYFQLVNSFYEKHVTASTKGTKMLLTDKQQTNNDILAILCIAIQRFIDCRLVNSPISHLSIYNTTSSLVELSFLYGIWIRETNDRIKQGKGYDLTFLSERCKL